MKPAKQDPGADFFNTEDEDVIDFTPDNSPPPDIKVTKPPKGGAPAELNKVNPRLVRKETGGSPALALKQARTELQKALLICGQNPGNPKLAAATSKIEQAITWIEDELRQYQH